MGAAAEAGRGQHAVLCLWSLVQRGLLARRLAHRPLRQGAQLRLRRHRCTTAPTALQPPNGDSAEARANKEVVAGRAFDAHVVVRAGSGSGGVATLAFEFKPSGAADHLRDDIPHIGIPNFVEFGAAEEVEEQGPGEGGGRKVPANGNSAAASAADGDAGSEAEAGAMQLRQGGFQSGAAPKGPAFYFGVIKGQVGGQAVEKAVRCQVGTSHQGQTRPCCYLRWAMLAVCARRLLRCSRGWALTSVAHGTLRTSWSACRATRLPPRRCMPACHTAALWVANTPALRAQSACTLHSPLQHPHLPKLPGAGLDQV